MSLSNCEACGKPVSTSAKACPACGHPINPPNYGLRVVLVLVLLGAAWLAYQIHQGKERAKARDAEYERVLNNLRRVGEDPMSDIYGQVARDAITQYEIARREGDAMQICSQASMVVAAVLQSKDEPAYKRWKKIEADDCRRAGVPR